MGKMIFTSALLQRAHELHKVSIRVVFVWLHIPYIAILFLQA